MSASDAAASRPSSLRLAISRLARPGDLRQLIRQVRVVEVPAPPPSPPPKHRPAATYPGPSINPNADVHHHQSPGGNQASVSNPAIIIQPRHHPQAPPPRPPFQWGVPRRISGPSEPLTVHNVQRIEAGEINILITTAKRIRTVLGCSWDYLMEK